MRRVLFALLLGGCSIELEHGLDERQANQIVALLETQGIGADKVFDDATGQRSYKVAVGRGDVAHAFALLEASDLPRGKQRGLEETFADSGLLPSPAAERARLQAALSAELERTLESIPQVLSARVHLAIPVEEPLGGEIAHERATASVLIKTRAPVGVAPEELKKLVAGAVSALQPADVSIIIAPAVAEPPPGDLSRVGPVLVSRASRPLVTGLAAGGLFLLFSLSLGLAITSARLVTLRRRLRKVEKPSA